MRKQIFLGACCFCVTVAQMLDANYGYHMIGYGVKTRAMGGVSVAYPQEAQVLSTNPAGLTELSSSFEIGLQIFSPPRKYSYTLPERETVESNSNHYPVPFLGFVKQCNSRLTYGAALYGMGLGTNYPKSNPTFGSGKLGVEYEQVLLAFGAGYKINECHSIGIAPLFMLHRIRFFGLQNFRNFSETPDKVSNNSYDYKPGLGVRFGWLGSFLCDKLKLGAGFSTKIYAERFDKYKGIVPERGNFDSPIVLQLGASYQYSCDLDLSVEYQRIFYSGIRALHNPLVLDHPLGSTKGPGFGWDDVDIFKLGVKYRYSSCLDLMTGFSLGSRPYDGNHIDINIITPAVTRHHVSLGFTYHINRCSELNLGYVYTFRDSVKGTSIFHGSEGDLGEITHSMYQHSVDLGYSCHF